MEKTRCAETTSPAMANTRTDEELIQELAQGGQDSLGPLYARYAGAIFRIAEQSLDRAAAEEIVQDVFLAIWRSAMTFDAQQGAFRPWLFQLAHWKILNELRRRRRRPAEHYTRDDEEDLFADLADRGAGPEERAWRREHRQIVHSALESLPARQREAVRMAFLEDMTQEQVAHALDVPLGTAKTRIRSGLQVLRTNLAPMAASLLGLGLAVVGFRYVQSQVALNRDERALTLVTTSDLAPFRLTPAATVTAAQLPASAHANYRGRPGTSLAVLTAEGLPVPPAGRAYQAWVRHGQSWTAIGMLQPEADGTARLIAENDVLATPPDAVEITAEQGSGSQAPSDSVLLAWVTP
jgi:RNA polymerase sigma-70 factor, ECF subfamily